MADGSWQMAEFGEKAQPYTNCAEVDEGSATHLRMMRMIVVETPWVNVTPPHPELQVDGYRLIGAASPNRPSLSC